MSATEFSVDLDDIRFTLFDVLDIDQTLKNSPKYSDFDEDTLVGVLEEAARLSIEVLHPINRVGDQQGCRLDGDGNVTTPDGFKAAWDVVSEGGWHATTAPTEVGGFGLPMSIAMATTEMFSGAAMAFAMYGGLASAAARVIMNDAPEPFRTLCPAKMFAGEWGGTMCLTEAGAGTAVGDNRCRATPTDEPGVYDLEGEKIFISGGDHDLTENIVHLVLARTPDAPSGSKGISIFLVPKFLFDEDGSLGARNDAKVVGIEHKMGINGSATCVLALGTSGPCKGWLIGEEGAGLPIMFKMMNEARIGVAVQGLSASAAAYNFSRGYARDRVQGTSLRELRNADAERITIDKHPDVRRMLMTQKVFTETMRSFLYRLSNNFDLAENSDTDEPTRKKLHGRVDLLVPVAKATCTDIGFDMSVVGVQIHGGYGFIQEYPIEQLARDAKIMSIYEGTNGVQAMDLLGRKMRVGGGALFMDWMQDMNAQLAEQRVLFPTEAATIEKSVQHLGAAAMHLGGLGMKGEIESAMLQATPFCRMFGLVCLALEALDQACVAHRCIEERGTTPRLRSKALNLRFFVNNLLPEAIALGKAVQASDTSCLDEELFA